MRNIKTMKIRDLLTARAQGKIGAYEFLKKNSELEPCDHEEDCRCDLIGREPHLEQED